jgi:lipopolysaccharide transport system ATP-binding protein
LPTSSDRRERPIAIRVEGLGKQYRIGRQLERYRTLREALTAGALRVARGAGSLMRGQLPRPEDDATIWALRDVSLEIARGDVLGVVGGNGAGKSTFLKVLSRITEPTTGYGEIHGRVGSLLEVGTGFHPELTGRENVYLNGAILGMRRSEIARKFDEIVAFAEVERFLDTPVKRYSSGMYLRLAFAVAAHLEPEILLVDEVLAVGDAAFQKKCLGKMSDVASEGRTVLFVSHNMTAVQSLCTRAIWLQDGRIVARGLPGQVVSAYLQSSVASRTERIWTDPGRAPGTERVRLQAVRVRPQEGAASDPVTVRTPFVLEFEYVDTEPERPLVPSLHLFNREGTLVFAVGPTEPADQGPTTGMPAVWRERCHVPGDLLNDGTHRVNFYLADGEEIVLRAEDVLAFEVQDSADLRGGWFGSWIGAIRPALRWESERLP